MSDDYAGPGVPTFGPPLATCPECNGRVVVLRSAHRYFGGPHARFDGHLANGTRCPGSGQAVPFGRSGGSDV